MQLKEIYGDLCDRAKVEQELIWRQWDFIEKQYSAKGRYYHTLHHLENLYEQLEPLRSQIIFWDEVLWTLFYHDVIYSVSKSDNELQSALVAEHHLQQMGLDHEAINRVKSQIMATKQHELDGNPDTAFFLDADLSVLGAPAHVYNTYARNVRKEFIIYPDLMYNKGRKKVLLHFLSMENIYKTDYFRDRLEQQAKANLKRELTGQ